MTRGVEIYEALIEIAANTGNKGDLSVIFDRENTEISGRKLTQNKLAQNKSAQLWGQRKAQSR